MARRPPLLPSPDGEYDRPHMLLAIFVFRTYVKDSKMGAFEVLLLTEVRIGRGTHASAGSLGLAGFSGLVRRRRF